jgi:DHA1 family bicyclomycin/chloramphenicol resistance-like MFS transporter
VSCVPIASIRPIWPSPVGSVALVTEIAQTCPADTSEASPKAATDAMSPVAPVTPPPGRGGAVRLVALLGAMTAVGAFSIDMYLPALPQLADQFHVGAARVQLTITACLLGLGLGQLFLGPISDRWGRRRPVLAGLLLYAAASIGCAVAPTIDILTAARVLQGVAAGTVTVIARAIVRDRYSGRAAAAYFSQLTLVFGVAPVLAPTIGGAVLRFTTWPGVFVALTVLGAGLLLAAMLGLAESLPPARRAVGGVRQALRGFGTILRDRAYLGYLAALAFAAASLFCYVSGSSFVLQEVYGASPQVFALLFGLNAAGLVAAGQVNARLVRRVEPRTILRAAILAMAITAVALLLAAQAHSLAAVEGPLFAFMTGFGIVLPNAMALALEHHAGRAGSASALLGGAQSAAGAIAAPTVGLINVGGALPMAAGMAGTAALAFVGASVALRAERRATHHTDARLSVGAPSASDT